MFADLAGFDGVIVVIVIAVVLFGGSQIPKLARSLGSAHTEFKKGLAEGAAEGSKDEDKDKDKNEVKDTAKTDGAETGS
jgi:sec-independent protein translocase protein TatA